MKKRPVLYFPENRPQQNAGTGCIAGVNNSIFESYDIVEVIGSSPTNPTKTASLANAGFAVFCCVWKHNCFVLAVTAGTTTVSK